MKTLGDEVAALLGAARTRMLIVAPFIRTEALSRLVRDVSTDVESVVVTRWRPLDLLAGASDLGVYDVAKARGMGLYLRHDLHAKMFAADDRCLVGSANVTLTALGWRRPSNLELLTAVPRTACHVMSFEEELLAGSVRATVEQRDRLRDMLARLQGLSADAFGADEVGGVGILPGDWIPRSRNPEELYSVYCGNRDVNRSALRTMREELKQIGTIGGMDEDGFRAWIAAVITQVPLVSRVIQRVDHEGQVTEGHLDLLPGWAEI